MSGQFFRALGELLGAARGRNAGGRAAIEHCRASDPGCAAVRGLPAYAQTALVCNRSVWVAFIRNDWLDVAASYPVPDGPTWLCARDVEEMSSQLKGALRRTTHLCGAPMPATITCGLGRGQLCLANGTTPTPACVSTCSLANQNFSCGSAEDPCLGCNAAWSIPALCATVTNRKAFCASTDETAEGTVLVDEAHQFYSAHCNPWSSMPMLRAFRVLVLNAGAHRLPSYAYHRKIHEMANVIRGYLAHGEDRVAIFRTTVPGFSGCNETGNAPPHASVASAEAYLRAHPFFDQHEFVPPANRIAMATMEKAGGRVLDVYPASILRLDDRAATLTYQGDMDCLHYRAPFLQTSLGLWARMLGEMLASSSSALKDE